MDALFTYRFDLVNSGICSSETVLPPDPLRVANLRTLDGGIDIRLSTLTGFRYRLNLYSLDGRRIWSADENALNRFLIDGVPAGVYVLSLEFQDDVFGRKVFIP